MNDPILDIQLKKSELALIVKSLRFCSLQAGLPPLYMKALTSLYGSLLETVNKTL
jgi:hypothetical protein